MKGEVLTSLKDQKYKVKLGVYVVSKFRKQICKLVMNDKNKVNNQDKNLRWFINLGLHPPSSLGLY